MCGRFTLKTSPRDINAFLAGLGDAELLESAADIVEQWKPRYNVAPTQQVLVLRPHQAQTMRWGLIPSWAEDEKIGYKMINARSETIAEKPAYKKAFQARRCLIVADGFYEWQTLAPKQKQPWHFRRGDGQPFAFAGLWDRWKDIYSCSIITTSANAVVSPAHVRMPVMLDAEGCQAWLSDAPADELSGWLRPFPSERMTAAKANPLVNSPANDCPDCLNSA